MYSNWIDLLIEDLIMRLYYVENLKCSIQSITLLDILVEKKFFLQLERKLQAKAKEITCEKTYTGGFSTVCITLVSEQY